MINSKQHQGCRMKDPGTRGKHQTKKKSLVYQQGLYGTEFRTLGPMAMGGGKQPTCRTARAQRTVRPLCTTATVYYGHPIPNTVTRHYRHSILRSPNTTVALPIWPLV